MQCKQILFLLFRLQESGLGSQDILSEKPWKHMFFVLNIRFRQFGAEKNFINSFSNFVLKLSFFPLIPGSAKKSGSETLAFAKHGKRRQGTRFFKSQFSMIDAVSPGVNAVSPGVNSTKLSSIHLSILASNIGVFTRLKKLTQEVRIGLIELNRFGIQTQSNS